SLPEGVFVVFSARKIPHRGWLASLGLQHSGADGIGLTTLSLAEIAHLLRAAGRAASRWAQAREVVPTMINKMRGPPLYFHYLVKEIEGNSIKPLVKLENHPGRVKA